MKVYQNPLTDEELEVMRIVWSSSEKLHTGEIAVRLRENRTWQTSAVASALNSLAKKGFVSAEKLGKVSYYTPLIDEDVYKSTEITRFVKNLFEDSPEELISALVHDELISTTEISDLLKKMG